MNTSKAKILILEDEAVTAQLYKMIIRSMKHSVSGIVDKGEDLIKSVEEIIPDLIISDIRVKGKINGLAAIREIRKTHKVPVIFITALSDSKTVKEMKVLSPCSFLIKPVFPNLIKEKINACLNSQK